MQQGLIYKTVAHYAPATNKGNEKCNAPEQFTLTLRALPAWGDVPATIRLKRFLKAALRSYGLKCTECREAPDQAGGPTPATIDQAGGPRGQPLRQQSVREPPGTAGETARTD